MISTEEYSQAVGVIANPHAQNGSLGDQWARIESILERSLTDFTVYHTEYPGHATELTRKLLDLGYGRIAVIGGDGSINEVVNGFFRDGNPINPVAELAVLPFGTGSDLRRTLGVPTDLEEAVKLIEHGRPRKIDVGEVLAETAQGERITRIFVNVASMGFSAEVAARANGSSKALGARMSYLWATIKELVSFHPYSVKVLSSDPDGITVPDRVALLALANGRHFGGGVCIAPTAELDSGQLELTVLEAESRWGLLRLLPRMLFNNLSESDLYSQHSVKQLEVTAVDPDTRVACELDGETGLQLPATVRVREKALWLLTPASTT